MDIPLTDDNSYFVNTNSTIFTKEQIDSFEKETIRLNENGDGDQVVLFLRKL